MPARKRVQTRGFILLDKGAKSYKSFGDKKTLINSITRLVKSGKSLNDYAVVPDKELAFDIGFTIYLKERAPRRKKRATRKPRTSKAAAKPAPRASRKPRTKPVLTPAEEKK